MSLLSSAALTISMNSQSYVQIDADSLRNILRISFVGEITLAHMPFYENKVTESLTQLSRDFSLITDLTDLSSMANDCIPFIKNVMELFNERGIGRIIRIVPDQAKDFGLNIMSLFHYRQGLEILTIQTRREADQLLNPYPHSLEETS